MPPGGRLLVPMTGHYAERLARLAGEAGRVAVPLPMGAAERADPHSTLAFYRAALAARTAQLAEGWDDDIAWLDLGADVLAFRRGPVTVVVNCGDDAIELPEGDVVVATEQLDSRLPANAGVWMR